MSTCKLDHSLEDVKKKLADQTPFLLPAISEKCLNYLTPAVSQAELNELFHLLKKYDLASSEEKKIRDQQFAAFFSK
jgi:hypothetical protein